MKRQIACGYCGKQFFSPIKKMWVVWLCDSVEMETTTESGETIVIHDKNRIKTCGAFPSYAEAVDFVIPDMEKDQCKDIERIDTVKEQFCKRCLHDSKCYYDNLMARTKKTAKQRMKERGVNKTGDSINPIPEDEYKAYVRWTVDNKVKADLQMKMQAEKKAEEDKKKAEEAAMAKREKILGGKPDGVEPTREENKDQ